MLPFYHFGTANKKATLRKVHSRKELFSFLKKLNFSSNTRLFPETQWVRIAYILSRISLFLH